MPADHHRDYAELQRRLSQGRYADSMNAYRQPATSRQRQANPEARRYGRWLLILLLVVVGVVAGWFVVIRPTAHGLTSVSHTIATVLDDIDGGKQRAAQAKAEREAAAQAAARAAAAKATASFAAQVNAVIAANPSTNISISTVTPISGLQHYGTSSVFLAASTGKLITATDFLHHVEIGKASLTQTIGGSSAEHLLEILIVNSDDTAWDELNEFLTYPDLEKYAATMGITDYQAYPNKLTSNDIAIVLNHLYNTNLLNSADRSLLLGYMQRANYRQYVVPAVPTDDVIYHKIGLYLDNVHDATIITHGNQWLILVIFTSGSGSPRAAIMQQIAKDAIADFLPGT
jgi:beta-lactamase class A